MCILFTPPVFSIFFCSRWWWPCSEVTAGQHWERKMPAVRIELLAPKTTSAAQVWAAGRQQSFGRSLPHPVAKPYWRMSKDADLEAAEVKVFSLPLYNGINCFWGCSVEGCSDVCCGKMKQYFLLPLAQNPFGPTQCIRYSWPPLGHILPPVLKYAPRMASCVQGLI